MIQCNYTQIPNDFLDNLHRYSESATKVFLAICRKTIGWHKLCDRISYSQLQEITGLATNSLKNGITELIKANLIIQESTKYGYKYDLNISHNQKEVSNFDTPGEITLSKSDIGVSNFDRANPKLVSNFDRGVSNFDSTKETNIKEINKETNKKEKEKEFFSSFFPFNELLIYFNTTTKKPVLTFSPTVTHRIQQWVDTGYTINDFKRIIDIKTASWLNNPKMDSQLRPDILFGDKFQYYVNEKTPEQIEQQQYEQEDTEYQKRQQKRLIEQHEKDEKEKAARNLARIERENKEKADEIRRKEVGEMAEDPEFLRKMLKDVLKSKRIDA